MLLALVRHAVAEPRKEGAPDAARALTPRGRKRLRRARTALSVQRLRFGRLLHSPWRRAEQTAHLLARFSERPPEAEPLLCRAPSPALLRRLAGPDLLLVGHQPWLGELLAWLAFGERRRGTGCAWQKGGVALLRGEPRPGGMALEAFLPARMLRRWAQA